MKIPDIVESAIEIGMRCEVKTWLELKKILLLSIPSSERSLFSTRDPQTKRHKLNEVELIIVDTYQKKTGTILEIPR